jgi:drug/metabolite transporter (DMT)-like permease
MVSTFASFAFALPYYLVLLTVLYFLGKETFHYSLAFWVLVLLRSVTDTFAEGMKMYAFAHGDISLVSCFMSMSPLFLLITSPLITGDPLTWTAAISVVLVVAGSLILVYRPPSDQWAKQKRGVFLALGAAVFFSLNSCFDRLAVQKGTPVFSAFTMTLICALFLLPLIVRRTGAVETMSVYRGEFALRGLLEVSFMVCKLYAMQFLDAPEVTGLQRTSLLLSIIGGRVFFKEQDFWRRLAAGLCIAAGVILIAVTRALQ